METQNYPRFDPEVELASVEARIAYLESQIVYYEAKAQELRRCIDEDAVMQVTYGLDLSGEKETAPEALYAPGAVITDDMLVDDYLIPDESDFDFGW